MRKIYCKRMNDIIWSAGKVRTLTTREDVKVGQSVYIPAGTPLQLRHPFSRYNTFQAVIWKGKVIYIHSSFFKEVIVMELEQKATVQEENE
jgi:hypothetical protein